MFDITGILFLALIAFFAGGVYVSDRPIRRVTYLFILLPLLAVIVVFSGLAADTTVHPSLFLAVLAPFLIAYGYIIGGRLTDIGWDKGHAAWSAIPAVGFFFVLFLALPKSKAARQTSMRMVHKVFHHMADSGTNITRDGSGDDRFGSIKSRVAQVVYVTAGLAALGCLLFSIFALIAEFTFAEGEDALLYFFVCGALVLPVYLFGWAVRWIIDTTSTSVFDSWLGRE